MRQLQIADRVYEKAERSARAAGYDTVDAYVADILDHESVRMDRFDHLFTPARLARIEKAAADIKSGRFYTPEEVDGHIAETRDAWLRENPR